MTNEMTCIKDTEFSQYFENATKNTIFRLEEESSEKAWDSEIHQGSSTFSLLPDNCWVVPKPNNISIGKWIEAYDNGNNFAVEEILRESFDWPDDTIIRYFLDRSFVLQVKWCDFLRYWDDFLALEDDCPIVIPQNGLRRNEAIIFDPSGYIFKIGNK